MINIKSKLVLDNNTWNNLAKCKHICLHLAKLFQVFAHQCIVSNN